MKCFPIIPIGVMLIFSTILILYILKKNPKKFSHYIIIICLLFLINLRIMIPKNQVLIEENNLDIYFVIDNTISMTAEDYNHQKTRISAVKKDCENIIKELNGARFSIITFDNTAKILTPLTKDKNITNDVLDIIIPIEEFYAKGSSLNTPYEILLNSLKENKEEQRQSILFFMSDGEITNESKLQSYKELKSFLTNGAVLGYGTTSGGLMKSTNNNSLNEYIMDWENYQKALSKIDEENLKKIADDMKLDYIHMENEKNIQNKLQEIKKSMTKNNEFIEKEYYNDTYFYFVIPLCILLTIELKKYGRIKL